MKKIIGLISICYAYIATASVALAGQGVKDHSALSNVAGKAGLSSEGNLGSIVGKIISAALSLVGIIFLILMVYAGLMWMTAQGKDEQIEKAKKIIIGSLIGLFITVSAYAITVFVTGNFVS